VFGRKAQTSCLLRQEVGPSSFENVQVSYPLVEKLGNLSGLCFIKIHLNTPLK